MQLVLWLIVAGFSIQPVKIELVIEEAAAITSGLACCRLLSPRMRVRSDHALRLQLQPLTNPCTPPLH